MTTTGPPRGFPVSEYEKRTSAAQALMTDEGVEALLLSTEPEVRYFTGFLTPFWQSPTRPWFVVVPRDGRPIAVIPSIGEESMAATWIDDIRTWDAPRPTDDGISLLGRTLIEVAGADGRVGLPTGPETHLRMPLDDFEALRARVGGTRFVDATNIVRTLRTTKSVLEIAKIAHICGIVSDGFEAIP